MKIKIERFWDSDTKKIIQEINDSLKRMEITPIQARLKDLFGLVKDSNLDSKIRVSLCFTLEKLAQYEPFREEIIEFFLSLLEKVKDSHVKEFAVYILGNLVLENPNLALITQTLPIFVRFCRDSSDYVRTCAEDVRDRLNQVKKSKIQEKEVIDALREELREFMNQRIDLMNQRTSDISKKALNLDYEAAYENQERMVEEIRQFSEFNDKAEQEIKRFIQAQVEKNPLFEGEFKQDYADWKKTRAEKEDLIRQVHCILRIQSKIYKIIQYIRVKGQQDEITLEELKSQTKGGLRGEWKNQEIIETLEKLVEEEIIPNLFLQQVKDLKGLMNLKNEDTPKE